MDFYAIDCVNNLYVNTPLHALKPDYPVPYGVPVRDSIVKVLDRIFY